MPVGANTVGAQRVTANPLKTPKVLNTPSAAAGATADGEKKGTSMQNYFKSLMNSKVGV